MVELEKQLKLVYSWLQGEFDNNCQYQRELELQKSSGKTEPAHDWVRIKCFPADLPKFGEHVLLVRQGFRSGQLYRQRLYKFEVNYEEGCVVNQIYRLKDESLFEKAEDNPSSVAHLDPVTDAEYMKGCAVYWKFLPDDNQFHATTKQGSCRFQSKFFPGKTIISNSDIYLSSTELWMHDRGVDTDGNKMYGFKSEEHHKFLHCETYKGSAEYEGHSAQKVSVHNQGGEVRLGAGRYVLKLEQVIEVETDCKLLKLTISDPEGQDNVVGKVVSDWNAGVIGGEFGKFKVYLEKS